MGMSGACVCAAWLLRWLEPEVTLRYVQGTSPLVEFVQVVSRLRGAFQTADLTLRQAKPATDLRLSEYRPMLVSVGVEHLTEVPGLQCVS